MAKTSSKKKPAQQSRTRKPKNQPSRRQTVARPGMGLDPSAAAYAKLLMHPCDSNLTHPTYGGSEGGYLIRSEGFTTVGSGTTDTSGFIQWTPGMMGPNNTEFLFGTGSSSGTSMLATAAAVAPGKAFLTATASVVRCVAACVKVSYPGAELDRSGRFHFGGASGSLVDSGQTVTVDGMAGTLEHYTRTPAGEIEIVWKPNAADQMFTDPNIANGSIEKDRKAAIVCAFTGLKAAQGINVRMTAVYEWQPQVGQGVAVPNTARSLSNNSLDQVINAVQRTGFKFMRGMFQEAGVGMATGAMRMLGNIGSRQNMLLTY